MTAPPRPEDPLRVLWPDAAVQATTAGRRSYLAVPSRSDPRLLLPSDNRGAARRAVATFARGDTWGGRARGAMLAAACAGGVAPLLLRQRVWVEPAHGIEAELCAAMGRPVVPAVSLGPRRANRKPVLLLMTPHGRPLGFAKVATNELTARLVAAEAAALDAVARSGLPDVTAPRLLHTGTWSGRPYLVQEALPVGTHTDPPTRHRLLRCVSQIAEIAPLSRQWLHAGPYRERLLRRLDALPQRPLADELRSAVLALPDARLTVGHWHGDLTRWNLASTPRRDFVWDWERMTDSTPLGFDALHYELNEALRGSLPAGMRRWMRRAEALLRDPMLHRGGTVAPTTVMALYLVELGARYAEDRQDRAGGRRGDLAQWLLPGLRTLLGRDR